MKTTESEIKALINAIVKSLGSSPGAGGDLIVPAMGTHNIGFRRDSDKDIDLHLEPKKKRPLSKTLDPKLQKSRPIKKRIKFQGIDLNLEFLAGDEISGEDEKGPWKTKFKYPYGEVAGSMTLADRDPVDIYLGPNKHAKHVYIVHQKSKTGKFDEDKCLLGFSSPQLALKAYYDHAPWWGGSLGFEKMTVPEFKHGYLASNRLEMRKSIKAKPENIIDMDIKNHSGHEDKHWSKIFKNEFNIDKLDVGNKSDEQIIKVLEDLKAANIPDRLFKDVKVAKELHFEKPVKIAPTIKGYFKDRHYSNSKDGRIYIFDMAFKYADKPYRLPGVTGLAEIIVHEIGHLVFAYPLKKYENEFMDISGWKERTSNEVPKGYVVSKQNPRWMYRDGSTFTTNYGSKQPGEDFSESWAAYIFRPDILRNKCPEKYKFFMKHVGKIDNKWWKKYEKHSHSSKPELG